MTIHPYLDRLRGVDLVARSGRVRRILPTYIQADGPNMPLGALCDIEALAAPGDAGPPWEALAASGEAGPTWMVAQVVGIDASGVTLTPLTAGPGTFLGAHVLARAEPDAAPVGERLQGRALDALGRPIDGAGPTRADRFEPLQAPPAMPLERETSRSPLETGVRAIDALLTLGHGQRIGVFAASGVGKTSLLIELARHVQADHCVICLIGERGREAETFWSHDLPASAKARSTLIAATSDQPAAMRVRAAHYALAVADHWRRHGRHVLLLLDSVTRLAMALREIGLAAGEPPTVRAYTPGVFAAIPKLVERCGAMRSGGSITAIMTVLSETDEVDDPISEMMKSLLDGHIVLSRALAEQSHYPAIDVPRSISRLADDLRSAEHAADAHEAVKLLGAYEGSKTLIEAGLYAAGSNPDVDRALLRRSDLMAFLRQARGDRSSLMDSRQALARAVGRTP
jgi:flagellum-specific ATP synthase